MIQKILEKDVSFTADLHIEGMPNDFLPSFGERFLHKLHVYLLRDKHVIALKFAKAKPLAILFASTNSSATLRSIMISKCYIFFPYIFKKLITHPKTFKFLWQTFFYSNKYSGSTNAELLILSVSESVRNRGIGQKLMSALKKEFKRRNIKEFRVSTLDKNEPANSFYKKTGGKFVNTLEIYERKWNVYQYSLS